MSIVSKLVTVVAEKAISGAPGDAAIKILDKAEKGIDNLAAKKQTKEDKKLANLKKEYPNHVRLILVLQHGKFKESYSVYDENDAIKYLIKGERLSKKHHLHIYDMSGKVELGMAKEKLIAFRNPLSMDLDPKDFELFLCGQLLGKMKTKASLGKKKYVFDFNDWSVEGDFLRNTYQIKSGESLIMKVTDKTGTMVYDPYVLDIMDQTNEFLCLLIAVVIGAAKTTKKEENEFAKEQLKRSLDPFSSPQK